MAYRLIARFDDQTIRTTLHRGRNTIGSDASCEVCLPNSTVSRRHAVVTQSQAGLELEDLGSTNGTLLRSQRIERAALKVGDVFVIGRVVVLVEEVADDDLEIGIVVPRESFRRLGLGGVRRRRPDRDLQPARPLLPRPPAKAARLALRRSPPASTTGRWWTRRSCC